MVRIAPIPAAPNPHCDGTRSDGRQIRYHRDDDGHRVRLCRQQLRRRHPAETAPKEPAVPIKRSITPDYLICLEDGRKFKSLKRHLRTKYNMSPEEYRAKWGLPKDYPMVAPNYAKARSDLAKQMGLGQGGRQAAKKKRLVFRHLRRGGGQGSPPLLRCEDSAFRLALDSGRETLPRDANFACPRFAG